MNSYRFVFLREDSDPISGFEAADPMSEEAAMLMAANRLDAYPNADEVRVFQGVRRVGRIKRLAGHREPPMLLN